MDYYPINLELKDKSVLVVGGGEVAYRKLKRLAAAKAEIVVISPQLAEKTKKLIAEKKITYKKREFKKGDVRDKCLVIAATSRQQVNQQVGELAREQDLLVNVVDSKELSNFIVPAVVSEGELMITAATGGSLPALSRELRKNLEAKLGKKADEYLVLMGKVRKRLKEEIPEEKRREIFHQLADLDLIYQFGEDKSRAAEKINAILEKQGLKIELVKERFSIFSKEEN